LKLPYANEVTFLSQRVSLFSRSLQLRFRRRYRRMEKDWYSFW